MQETTPLISGIDSHAHVFLKDLPLTEGRRYAPSYDASLEQYQSLLTTHGMSHGVLVQPSFLGTDNSYLIACLTRFPGQFRGVVVLDPDIDLSLLDEYDSKGVVGIRANLIGKPAPEFSSVAWQAMFARMCAFGWHLEVQVEAGRLADISPAILQSGVSLVVDHFGRLDPALGVRDPGFQSLMALGKNQGPKGRVWVKISGAYRVSPRVDEQTGNAADAQAVILNTARDAYTMLKAAFGTERLMWGSDWPHTTFEATENYDTVYAAFNHVVTAPSDRRALLVDTPRELFHF